MVNPNMEWYLLAGMSDMPKIDIMLNNMPERGVIGIGEPPTVSTASAIANAVRNATGATIRSLPLHPHKVLAALEQEKSRRDAVKAFAYVNPANEKEAVAALKTDGIAMPIGGGQDLLARMKDYIDSPDRVVNVKNALDATITATPDGGLKIGAAVKIVDLAEQRAGRRGCIRPSSHAAGEVGTPQIRNQGTVGGNINQRPRCWYFRNEEFVCFKKGGTRCFAVGGENQYHAIFGNDGPSHIVHPSSLAVPFVAYGAKFRVVGPNGERESRGGRVLHDADAAERAEGERAGGRRAADARDPAGAGQREERPLRSALQGSRTTGRSRSRRSSWR